MLRTLLTLVGFVLSGQVTTAPGNDAELAKLVSPDVMVTKLATGMSFTEGPVWFPEDGGYLVFTDMNNARLKRWDVKNGVTTFREDAHNPNGNTRDLQGHLITCEHTTRRISIAERDGTVRVLVDRFE